MQPKMIGGRAVKTLDGHEAITCGERVICKQFGIYSLSVTLDGISSCGPSGRLVSVGPVPTGTFVLPHVLSVTDDTNNYCLFSRTVTYGPPHESHWNEPFDCGLGTGGTCAMLSENLMVRSSIVVAMGTISGQTRISIGATSPCTADLCQSMPPPFANCVVDSWPFSGRCFLRIIESAASAIEDIIEGETVATTNALTTCAPPSGCPGSVCFTLPVIGTGGTCSIVRGP